MRLPDQIYTEVKGQMAHHAPWHLARFRRSRLPPVMWTDWQDARAMFPGVKYLDEQGGGEEFLRFHRVMVQHYKWTLVNIRRLP